MKRTTRFMVGGSALVLLIGTALLAREFWPKPNMPPSAVVVSHAVTPPVRFAIVYYRGPVFPSSKQASILKDFSLAKEHQKIPLQTNDESPDVLITTLARMYPKYRWKMEHHRDIRSDSFGAFAIGSSAKPMRLPDTQLAEKLPMYHALTDPKKGTTHEVQPFLRYRLSGSSNQQLYRLEGAIEKCVPASALPPPDVFLKTQSSPRHTPPFAVSSPPTSPNAPFAISLSHSNITIPAALHGWYCVASLVNPQIGEGVPGGQHALLVYFPGAGDTKS